MDMGIKQLIADAKRGGMDGIEWATGEQQRDLYNNALRGVADEARYNPETEKLTVYKNGRESEAQSQIPERVPKDKIEDYIGKAGAERLLNSEAKNTYEIKLNPEETDYAGDNRYDVVKKGSDRAYYTGDEAGAKEWIKRDSPIEGQHIATDLSIDTKWPGKLYGDFSTGPSGSVAAGDFNYSATVPRLLKQYGKGEFEVSGKGEGWMGGDNPQQPVMWFTKDTPSSFPIYEGVTGVFSMLQEQIKKEGGGAKGVGKVAFKYGVPAALLAKFLSSDDEGKKKMLTTTALGKLNQSL
jgi:hypothetical protein